MIRAFIAIELPGDVRAAIGDVQDRLKRARLGVKVSWAKFENIHLTLQFLGDIPEPLIPKISAALTGIARRHAAFEVPVRGAGAFPGVNKPRVLWVGCGTGHVGAGLVPSRVVEGQPQGLPLQTLAQAVQMGMQEFGFEPEHREFAAHLTLGRIKFPRPDAALTRALDSLKDTDFGTLPVKEIQLLQSQLHPEGSIYTKLSSHRLASGL